MAADDTAAIGTTLMDDDMPLRQRPMSQRRREDPLRRRHGTMRVMTSFNQPAHGVRNLKLKVARHLQELASEALDNPNVNLGLAARISDVLWSLIDEAAERDDAARAAVRGAVDYFVLNRDEVPDLDDPRGFDDDAELVNQVARELGLTELTVRLR